MTDWLTKGTVAVETVADTMRAHLGRDSAAFAPTLSIPQRAAFDRLVDALNRLPRPLMALGTLGVIAAALIDPVWFAARMEALAAMPEPMWWLMGAVVSLHFGGRMQVQAQTARREPPTPPVPPA
jgi:hypothetical protein